MGQSQASQRLSIMQENVNEITKKIKTGDLTEDDRTRSHEILIDYVKEIKFILSKSVGRSRIHKVEKIIIAALEELATLEGSLRTVEPRLKAKSLQALLDIEKNMKTLNEALTSENYENEERTVDRIKKRLSFIKDVDQEVDVKKNEVLDALETTSSDLETDKKLRLLERRHYESGLDLNRFVGVSDSDSYKRYKELLFQLKEELKQISEVNDKISDRKKYLWYNIDNNISALNKKVRENEENIKKQIDNMEMFNVTTPVTCNQSINNVVTFYNDFEKTFSANCPLNELEEIFRQLSALKIRIDQKLKVLENQMLIQDIELVPVKESDDSMIQTLTMEDSSEIPAPPPRLINRIKKIRGALETLQVEIPTATYTKESHVYKNFKEKLEGYKIELDTTYEKEETRSLAQDNLKFIDDILILLDKNLIDPTSTTSDILVDIMSISTNVNELGNKIKVANNDIQYYKTIEDDLLDHLSYLRKLKISAARSNVCQFRDYVLIQIDSHLSNLERIKKNVAAIQTDQQNMQVLEITDF